MSLPIAKLAEIYQCHPRQVNRWRSAGFDILDPAKLAESLASQQRPGATLEKLTAPGALESTSQAIHKLFTTPKS
jgi:hypothetical protein